MRASPCALLLVILGATGAATSRGVAATAAADSSADAGREETFEFREGALLEPAGVVVDALGHVWVSDAAAHRVLRFDAAGGRLGEVGALGSGDNEFRRPASIARLGSLGVAVLDVENRRVRAFDLLGRTTDLSVALDDAALESVTGRVSPIGLAADRGAALYVADAERDRVLAFDFSGRYLRALGGYGAAPGAFHGLAAIAVAPHGELVAIERALPPPKPRKGAAVDSSAALPVRVQWLDPSGAPLRAFTVADPGAQAVPVAIAADDSGRVAIGWRTAAGGCLEAWGADGVRLARRTTAGTPRALAFAADGALLVAESAPARVRRLPFPFAAAKE